MDTHPMFDEILRAAVAVLGAPAADTETATLSRRVSWANDVVALIGSVNHVYFAAGRGGARKYLWIADDSVNGERVVRLDDALSEIMDLAAP